MPLYPGSENWVITEPLLGHDKLMTSDVTGFAGEDMADDVPECAPAAGAEGGGDNGADASGPVPPDVAA